DKKYPFHQIGASTRLRFIVRNEGPGPARDIEASILFDAGIDPSDASLAFSAMDVDEFSGDIPVRVQAQTSSVLYEAEVRWTNYDGRRASEMYSGELEGQRVDIDWDDLTRRDPYSLEAVTGKRLFVGRKGDLEHLLRVAANPTTGSAIIHGHKRVGKTSL